MKVQFTMIDSYVVDIPTSFRVSQHFTLKEIANNKASDDVKMIWNDDIAKFFKALEEFRQGMADAKLLNTSIGISVSSCYRTPAYNKSVGGSSNSDHLKALAVDITKQSFSMALSDNIRHYISSTWKYICMKSGVAGYINWYTNGFHLGFSDLYKQFKIVDYRGKSGDW